MSFQSHVDLGEFIGSADTEGTGFEMADVGQNADEVQGSPLAMWETEIQHVELEKGSMGLGFSILDYQVTSIFLISKEGGKIFCIEHRSHPSSCMSF